MGKGNKGTATRRIGASLSAARRRSHSRIAGLLTYMHKKCTSNMAVATGHSKNISRFYLHDLVTSHELSIILIELKI